MSHHKVLKRTDEEKSHILDITEVNSGVIYLITLIRLNMSGTLHERDLLIFAQKLTLTIALFK